MLVPFTPKSIVQRSPVAGQGLAQSVYFELQSPEKRCCPRRASCVRFGTQLSKLTTPISLPKWGLFAPHLRHCCAPPPRDGWQRCTSAPTTLSAVKARAHDVVRSRNDLTTCACADTCLCWRAPIRHATFVWAPLFGAQAPATHAQRLVHTQTTQGHSSSTHWVGFPS